MDFDLNNNASLRCALLTVILVIVIYILWTVTKKNEQLLLPQSYTSGATMRFNQIPTATDQREYKTGYNFEITDRLPKVEGFTPSEYKNQEEVLASKLYAESLTSAPEVQVSRELADLQKTM